MSHFLYKIKQRIASTPWVLGAFLIGALVCLPMVLILAEVISPSSDGWAEISERDPDDYLKNLGLENNIPDYSRLYLRSQSTVIMLFGVAAIATVLGILLAWIVSFWEFPLRKTLSFLLVLPMAIPSYILASAYKLLVIDSKNAWAVSYRSEHGSDAMQTMDQLWNHSFAIIVLALGFYPYIYIAARTAFSTLSSSYIDSARMLGKGSSSIFFTVALPLARPAIIGGLMLVCLETLNEFGAMKILGVNTLTTEIFYAWTNLGDKSAAIRISGCIMLIVFALLIIELILRGGKRYQAARSSETQLTGKPTSLGGSICCILICLTVFYIAFIIPVSKLTSLASIALPTRSISDFSDEIFSSLILAAKASLLIMSVALFLGYAQRLVPKWFMQGLLKFTNLGYAIPGAILGVTLITWSGQVNNSAWSYNIINYLFYSSSFGVLIAYLIRFLIVGLNPIEAGLKQIRPSIDDASYTLGSNKWSTFFRLHLPMLKFAISGGLIILFVDILKELPLTLIMNQETLATRAYGLFALEDRHAEGAIPALLLILTGVIAILIIRLGFKNQKN